MNSAPRLPEPRDTSWDRITFSGYTVENVKLLPRNLKSDKFILGDELDLDPWTLTFDGKLWNGGSPVLRCVKAIRFDGTKHHAEPIRGALEAHIEEFVRDYLYTKSMRAKITEWAEEHGEKHYRQAEAA